MLILNRSLLAVALSAEAVTLPAGATTGALDDGQLGGPPTAEAAASACPAGKSVIGVSGRVLVLLFNEVVASVTVLCSDNAPAVGFIGSAGEPQVTASCSTGLVAVGITGRESDFVDQLAVRCRAADLIGPITTSIGFGGFGGVADGPYDCPDGQVLSGLEGSIVFEGSTLRQLQLRCSATDTIFSSGFETATPAVGG